MTWNWQRPDWPRFSWDQERLKKAEEVFLVQSGVVEGVVRHLDEADREQLTIEAISSEALTTSEIEGEILDRASVQSSIRKQLGLPTEEWRATPAERGVADMMVDLYRSFAQPLSCEMLFRWHRILLGGRRDMSDVGHYRTSNEAMQIVSGPVHLPKVHFEAPPSSEVPEQMEQFIAWFNRTAPDGAGSLSGLTRAGIAHLHFESIHPFEDGNGRIGRAICEKALSQCLGQPTLTALAATMLLRRKAYYTALEAGSKDVKVTSWMTWFAGITIEAQRRTLTQIEFIVDKTKLLDGLRGRLNGRQEKALLRMLREGPEGFAGGMSARNYMTITGASPATVTRDLADMVAKGALRRTGERRYARYHVAIPLRPVQAVVLDEKGELKEA
ncbi:MAG: Fic family protein [Bryobacterales bacterium]|nr:Fic family protein [Bryobacterales bacterium]